jgi:hypothetical protein
MANLTDTKVFGTLNTVNTITAGDSIIVQKTVFGKPLKGDSVQSMRTITSADSIRAGKFILAGDSIRTAKSLHSVGRIMAGDSIISLKSIHCTAVRSKGDTKSFFLGKVYIGADTIIPGPHILMLANDAGKRAIAYSWGTHASSIQTKKEMAPVSNALTKITNISGIKFRWDTPNNEAINNTEWAGITAEDLDTLDIPGATTKDENGKYVGVNLTQVIPVLVEAIKEQQILIEDLRKDVDKLKKI